MSMVAKMYVVGVLVDDQLPDRVPLHYIQRAVKHYHESGDVQQTFHGVKPPERVMVVEAPKSGIYEGIEDMIKTFHVIDRMEGRET